MSEPHTTDLGTRYRYRREGAELERERIIKLLEEWGEEAGCFCCASDVAASEIIELIKGEQK